MEAEGARSEFQVVVIVEDDDGRLFPLTQDIPKCLLPVANRPLLAYTLDTIRNSGALEILVVCVNEDQEKLSQFLNNYFLDLDDKVKIELVCISSELISGSADYLRAVSHRIHGDFVVVGADMVTEMNLAHVVRLHRSKASDLVICVTPFQFDDADIGDEKKKSSDKVKKLKIDEEDQEYIGMGSDGRLVLKCSTIECEKTMTINKRLLNKCVGLTIRNDLIDVSVYVMSKWIMQLLMDHKKINSLKVDLIPYLLNKQFIEDTDYMLSAMGNSLLQRVSERPLQDVDSHLYSLNKSTADSSVFTESLHTATGSTGSSASRSRSASASGGNTGVKTKQPVYVDLGSSVLTHFLNDDDFNLHAGGITGPTSASSNMNSSDKSTALAHSVSALSMNSSTLSDTVLEGQRRVNAMKALKGVDLVRCFALIATPLQRQVQSVEQPEGKFICHRLSNIHTYLQLNREIPIKMHHGHAPNANASSATAMNKLDQLNPWSDINVRYQRKDLSVFDNNTVEQGAKVVLKYCSLGERVKIGAKSKLNNCVVLNGVTIGENCIIQNSVICADVVIENNCNLNDCCIGKGVKVSQSSKLKNEVMASDM